MCIYIYVYIYIYTHKKRHKHCVYIYIVLSVVAIKPLPGSKLPNSKLQATFSHSSSVVWCIRISISGVHSRVRSTIALFTGPKNTVDRFCTIALFTGEITLSPIGEGEWGRYRVKGVNQNGKQSKQVCVSCHYLHKKKRTLNHQGEIVTSPFCAVGCCH